ncbi:translation initiation factor 2 [Candidatus Pelagibacter sp. IMCC9063]|uniref:translation initiation factor IF-2 n=1 Tax=Pelagibacter sp. (strain IMCC9063) TaxID=1002672 RepID=UPI0002046701|nr:translation initiation factor IF-2 [Candidatus Pelagibacter sp. IMCC9063]AEA80816.1 translation initiation factor 2 [Candidatus Pelagibacter sp. IMCC9063]
MKRSREKLFKKQSGQDTDGQKVIRQVKIPKVITIQELANRMAERANTVIKYLLTKNVKVTINHTIDQDTAEFIVKEFGHEILIEEEPDQLLKDILSKDKDLENAVSRPPVVTVMGHVDHGKTSLLDSLRDASVVNSEHGGITQHIGAYQVNVNDKSLITFIDTPGHAAFTEMRARGSKITDIVILVVAANDGIKPQTIEAIQHAKAAQVPIIVAINKCDLQGADPTKVRNQLLEHELIVEEMGGDVLSVEISALKKTNLDKLKELILLQSEILDMKADPSIAAAGVVVESRLDKGRGPVSTVLIAKGTLKKGDLFVSGASNGKVRAIYNYRGDLINEAGPSTPVEIVGFQGAPNAGDDFVVVENDSKVEEIVEYRQQEIKNKKLAGNKKTDIFGESDPEEEYNIILKTDVNGSLEALANAIEKIKIENIKTKIILSAVGPITETDVTLAKASNAILLGFNIRPNKEAKDLARSYKLEILYFNIIYEALDHITKKISGLLAPETEEQGQGTCEVLEVFSVSKAGKVAGVKVTEGEIKNNSELRLLRDGAVVYTGKVNSLFREKNEAKEVKAGLECGVSIKDFNDIKKGDVIEFFKTITIEREI